MCDAEYHQLLERKYVRWNETQLNVDVLGFLELSHERVDGDAVLILSE